MTTNDIPDIIQSSAQSSGPHKRSSCSHETLSAAPQSPAETGHSARSGFSTLISARGTESTIRPFCRYAVALFFGKSLVSFDGGYRRCDCHVFKVGEMWGSEAGCPLFERVFALIGCAYVKALMDDA